MTPSECRTHVCLVSSETTPNLIPACDPQLRPKEVVLVVTAAMKIMADNLAEAFRQRGIQVRPWPIDNAYDYSHIRQRLQKLAGEYPAGTLALNATGGTKIMGFAAFDLFRERGLPVFYVQPEKDRLLWLQPDWPAQEIADCLCLEEFLQIHGYRVRMPARRQIYGPIHARIGQQLIDRQKDLAPGIGVLNWCAGAAESSGSLVGPLPGQKQGNAKSFNAVLDLLTQAGLAERYKGNVRFLDESARFFAKGGWLEDYLFTQVDNLKGEMGLQDAAMSVQVETSAGTRNEIDVAVLHNNRLHLIECKTRPFDEVGGRRGLGSQTLYKMDTLRDLGGRTTRSLLVSYRDLGERDRQRAADLGIQIYAGPSLIHVGKKLKEWLTR